MKKQLAQIFKNKIYVISFVAIMLVAYGFFLIKPGTYIDDIAYSHYVTDHFYLRQGRWGLWLIHKIMPIQYNTLWIARWLGFVFQAIAVVVMNCLMLKAIEKKPEILKSSVIYFFDIVYITYSMVNEILFFSSTYWLDVFGVILTLVAVGLVLFSGRMRPVKWIVAALLVAVAVSLFEANAGVFIVTTVIVLMLVELSDDSNRFCKIVLKGLTAVLVLGVALVLRSLIGQWIASANGVTLDIMHKTTWQSESLAYMLRYGIGRMLAEIVVHNGVAATAYFPMLEILVALIAIVFFFVRGIIKKQGRQVFLWFMMLVAAMSLNLVVGEVSYNRANYFVYAMVVAFCVLYAGMLIAATDKLWLKRAGLLAVVALIVLQTSDLVGWELRNNIRWQHEKETITRLGDDLTNWDIENKPVIFTGTYTLPSELTKPTHITWYSRRDMIFKKIFDMTPPEFYYEEDLQDQVGYKVNETGTNSIINWGMGLNFDETGAELRDLLAMQGYVIKGSTDEQWSRAIWDCKLMDVWPNEGGIADTGEYIIVNLQ